MSWWKQLDVLRNVLRLGMFSRTEAKLMEKCIEEIEEKRKRALERLEERSIMIDKYGASVISDWEEDDRYADDDFYEEKLRECYEKSRPVSRAMGLP